MELVQFYETQIADADSGLLSRFLVIPAYAFKPAVESLEELTSVLEFRRGMAVPSPAALSVALAATLDSRTLASAVGSFQTILGGRYISALEAERTPEAERIGSLLRFSDAIVFGEYIPFEASPLQSESLATLFAKVTARGGVAVGASAAIVGATTGQPLLVVFVAGGMVLGGAAKGLGKALEEGLYQKVLSALKVPEPIRGEGGDDEQK
ncbi:MAG: hypothetical protein ACRDTE_25045 [Pseudonocardiaceae bacterium]